MAARRDTVYDLVAIGGGTASLVATVIAAGLGARVAMVEAERPGGDCLWTGCVPSKTLIAAAAAAHQMRTADRHGLAPVEPTVDLAHVMDRVRAAIAEIEPHDSPETLEAEGVEFVQGRGRFDGPGRVVVGDRTLRYRTALIATGSRPTLPPLPGLADRDPLTSDTVWGLRELPRRLVVLGGGSIGCELGQAFSRLGSTVTIVEAARHLLPREDPSVGRLVADRFAAEGIRVRTGTTLMHVDEVPFDRILVATGRRPNTADLGLDTVGVEVSGSGHVIVDDQLRTTGPRIFAAGDVTGNMAFTHAAAHQGRVMVTNALLRTRHKARYDTIPWVTFTDPEIARVGLDAPAARERWGTKAVIQRFDYRHLDRAVTHGDTTGYAELVGDPKRRLVGATVVGVGAGEAIAELTAWLTMGERIDRVSTTVHAYPTFAEGPSRAADDLLRLRLLTPRNRRLLRPALAILRRVDRTR